MATQAAADSHTTRFLDEEFELNFSEARIHHSRELEGENCVFIQQPRIFSETPEIQILEGNATLSWDSQSILSDALEFTFTQWPDPNGPFAFAEGPSPLAFAFENLTLGANWPLGTLFYAQLSEEEEEIGAFLLGAATLELHLVYEADEEIVPWVASCTSSCPAPRPACWTDLVPGLT